MTPSSDARTPRDRTVHLSNKRMVSHSGEKTSPQNYQCLTNNVVAYTVTQTAELLGMSESWVREQCKIGGLPAKRIGTSWFVSRAGLEQMFGEPIGVSAQSVSEVEDRKKLLRARKAGIEAELAALG